MATSASASIEHTLREHLGRAQRARALAQTSPERQADRLAVRTYQQQRMAKTHAALLQSPRYAPAARFFLTELYSTADLTQRDADIERVIRLLVKFLPEKALITIAHALEMDALSESLDATLGAAARQTQGSAKPLKLTAERYANAYLAMGRHKDRERQMALVHEIGLSLESLSNMPFLLSLLKLMRAPARAGGVGELQSFLENGYAAFTHIKGATVFIETIVSQEKQEHLRLLALQSS